MTASEFEKAISVFIGGFAFTRSFTHPYLAETITDQVQVLRDAPRKRDDYRTDEFVAHDIPVAALDKILRENGKRHYRLCYILPTGASDAEMRAEFKALGYRLTGTEELMMHRLNGLTSPSTSYTLRQVTTEAEAEKLTKAAGRRQIRSEHLTGSPAPMRQYIAEDNGTPVGWVASVVVGDATWCSSMYVMPAFRRQGIARALLMKMLSDDRVAGSTGNVLLASHTGSKLYPTVGYDSLGMLYLYSPPKARKD